MKKQSFVNKNFFDEKYLNNIQNILNKIFPHLHLYLRFIQLAIAHSPVVAAC